MPPDESDFDRLIRAWREGQTGALGELFSRYSDRIRSAVRRRLPDKLRAQYDSMSRGATGRPIGEDCAAHQGAQVPDRG